MRTSGHVTSAAAMTLVVLAACHSQVSTPCYLSQFIRSSAPIVVVVTIDGIRWQEVFYGPDSQLRPGATSSARELVPNLYRLFFDGGTVFGRDSMLVASGRHHVSLPGYLEIMRGAPATDCFTNFCSPTPAPTLLDYFDRVAVFSSWSTIRRALGARSDRFIVSAGRDFRTGRFLDLHIPDDKDFVRDVGHMDYRPDRFTERSVMNYLERETPQILWVALGDSDEHAHSGDYGRYLSSLMHADAFIGDLVRRYEGKNAVFIVTTDHGRSRGWSHHGSDDSSSRVWLMIRGMGVPSLGSVRLPKTRTLSDVLPTILRMTHGIKTNDSLL